MAADEKWYFSKEQLANTPSRKFGYDADKELSCRQQAANFIQDMGQRLQVTQLCINTAIVYMHRFYMFHSFSRFHRNAIAAAALFLAAKVEEQPRKLEHVIKVAQICLHREHPPADLLKSEMYHEQAQELVVNENILLQTLGFDVAIDHPHTHVVRCCHLVRASKDLAQTSYFMASNSLHLTSMCLQYKPTVVACFCIHLACKWSNWEIPQSNEGKPWFWYVDRSVTQELLEQLTDEFLVIFEKCPSRFKKKIMSLSTNQSQTILSAFGNVKDALPDKKRNGEGITPSAGSSNISSANEELKKKQEYQRHHADYKKHHLPMHSRPDSHNMPPKSSCMFGPPQRTLPPGHSNSSSGGTGGSSNNSSISSHLSSRAISNKPSIAQQQDVQGLGKPEHLHHRPRRPDDKHSSRNHESIPPPYKKYENKVTSSVLNDFTQSNNSCSTSISNSNSNRSVGVSSAGYSNIGPTSYQQMQPPVSSEHTAMKSDLVSAVTTTSSGTVNLPLTNKLQQSVPSQQPVPQVPHHSYLAKSNSPPHSHSVPTIPTSAPSLPPLNPPPPLPPPVPTPVVNTSCTPPPPLKPERSIFSPEKGTPPPLPLHSISPPSHSQRRHSSSSEHLLVTKDEPYLHLPEPTKTDMPATVKDEKPDHSSISLNSSVDSIFDQQHSQSTSLTASSSSSSQQLSSQTTVDDSYSKEKSKKKKKHKEHKEKHKEKHKHKHKNREPEPIVITIPKEKLTLPSPEKSLKIKIPKDKIAPAISPGPTGLKIKISGGKIKDSKKRERSEDKSPDLPSKYHRPNGTTLQVGMEQSGRR